jgi:NhaP-type Na+/H+ or K+/H+ antiporter
MVCFLITAESLLIDADGLVFAAFADAAAGLDVPG